MSRARGKRAWEPLKSLWHREIHELRLNDFRKLDMAFAWWNGEELFSLIKSLPIWLGGTQPNPKHTQRIYQPGGSNARPELQNTSSFGLVTCSVMGNLSWCKMRWKKCTQKLRYISGGENSSLMLKGQQYKKLYPRKNTVHEKPKENNQHVCLPCHFFIKHSGCQSGAMIHHHGTGLSPLHPHR